MTLVDQIKEYAKSISADFKEKKGSGEINIVVAERKAFLSKEKLSYQARFRVDEAAKVLRFTEMLKESSSGMQNAGISFGTESFKTGQGGQLESVIAQQADQFSRKYEYQFDFKTVRSQIEVLAGAAGYDFQYQITAKGL